MHHHILSIHKRSVAVAKNLKQYSFNKTFMGALRP